MKKNSKTIISIGIAIILIITLVLISLLMPKQKYNNGKDMSNQLIDIGKKFYEEFYYERVEMTQEERVELLSKFTKSGINFNLENLEKYNNGQFKKDINNILDNNSNQKCDKKTTKIIIYPKEPYGKTNYTIKTELDCTEK